MASDQSDPATVSLPSAEEVGDVFFHQYYGVLQRSPSFLYQYYQESSKLGRPDPDGNVDTVSTMDAIAQKLLAMNYSECEPEIKTVDAQDSLNGGVIVLVTGHLTRKDEVKRDFIQSFFLAPQDTGYFVLNDIFRFTDKGDRQQGNMDLPNGTDVPISPERDVPLLEQVVEQISAPITEDEDVIKEEVSNPSDNEEATAVAVVEEEVPVEEAINGVPIGTQEVVANPVPVTTVQEEVPVTTVQEEVPAPVTTVQEEVPAPVTTVQEEAPKMSYASIVKVMKENPALSSVPMPVARPARTHLERPSVPAPRLPLVPAIPAVSSIVSESSTQEAEADGYSIYIKGLPLNATAAQLEEEFKKFGPIKPAGIQVRSQKLQGFCFAFVEFEVASAVQSALKASPLSIGGRQATIEEKRTTVSRVSNRGRFASGGGYRGDGMRGRGSYGGGRGYGRGDYGNMGESGNRGGGRGGSSHRVDAAYQRFQQASSNGGRIARTGSFNGNSSASGVPATA